MLENQPLQFHLPPLPCFHPAAIQAHEANIITEQTNSEVSM